MVYNFEKVKSMVYLLGQTLCLFVSSADNLCKQFGPKIQTVCHSDGIPERIF